MNAVQLIEKEHLREDLPEFRVGDRLKVYLKVVEGNKTRVQLFEGICIRRRGSGTNASFTVIKESHGEIVEKIFPLHSPSIDKIQLVRKGKVRRAKLYYLKSKNKKL